MQTEHNPTTALWPKARRRVLGLLFAHPDHEWHLRDIARLTDLAPATVQREVVSLHAAGMLTRRRDGNLVKYGADRSSPIFEELRGIALKTGGEAAAGTSAMTPRIAVPKQAVADFCRRNRIRRLSLFGSVLRDDFGPDSDVDVLVEFEPEARVGLFDLNRMQTELSQILGHRVDLNTPGFLSDYFRDEVLKEAQVQYAAR